MSLYLNFQADHLLCVKKIRLRFLQRLTQIICSDSTKLKEELNDIITTLQRKKITRLQWDLERGTGSSSVRTCKYTNRFVIYDSGTNPKDLQALQLFFGSLRKKQSKKCICNICICDNIYKKINQLFQINLEEHKKDIT